MTKLSFCVGGERGDLDLEEKNNYPPKEEGKRSYSCVQNVYNYCLEFCANGTIHGVRYLTERRTGIEKLWWLVSLVVSLYFGIYLISSAYDNWQNSPVIVSFATKETPVWQIPFPAVTICPDSKARPSIFNYTYYLHKKQDNEPLTEDEEKKFGYLSYICDTNFDLDYNKSGKFADTDFFDFLEEVQPEFDKIFRDCRYLSENYNCSDLFKPIIIDDGICYTFNLMDRTQLLTDIVVHHKDFHSTQISHDWNLEDGYSKHATIDSYPRRALFAGIPNALEVKLTVDENDLDYTCGTSIKGFKVAISHPQRMPRVKQQHFIVPLNRVAKAAIAPDMMTTSEAVKQYKPSRRNCYFPSEKSLKYFRVYSQNNCYIECYANFTISQCGCVEFFMPREKEVPICGAENHKCIKLAKRKMAREAVERKIDYSHSNFSGHKNMPNCKCLPICTSMYYNIENTQANWDWRTVLKHNRLSHVDINNKKKHMSMLQVFFKGNQFLTSDRNELYGSTEFLANVGGLLGLFIGFSVLSFIEIVYYLSLRVFCNIAMFGRGNWSGKVD